MIGRAQPLPLQPRSSHTKARMSAKLNHAKSRPNKHSTALPFLPPLSYSQAGSALLSGYTRSCFRLAACPHNWPASPFVYGPSLLPAPSGCNNTKHAPMAAATYADFSLDGPEIGTLVIVVDRAKNLPNRKTTKQDPYCQARLGKTCNKTKTDRRGGQTPRW
jgi:hypothetical protein